MTYDPYADNNANSPHSAGPSYGPSSESPAAQGPGVNGYGPPQPAYGVPTTGYAAPQTGYAAPGYGQSSYTPPGYAVPGQPYAPGFAPYGQPLTPYANPMLAYDPNSPGAPLFNASPVQALKRFWSKGLTFTGRASRSEYWWMSLWQAVAYFAIGLLIVLAGTISSAAGWLTLFVLLCCLLLAAIPSIALQVRRLHDTNQSGWLILLHLIPYLGSFILFIFMLMPSNPAGARYDY